MNDWKSILNADPTDWLLEEDNPSVRYFTLVDLLSRPEQDPEVRQTKAEIMQKGTVPEILAKQQAGGYWDVPEKFYAAKYTGTVWQVLILAELGADGNDPRIHQACEFLLENSQDRQSYGFSTWASSKAGGGRKGHVIPCLTGNLIYSLIRFGYLQDARVQNSIDWIARVQRFDDGTEPHSMDWPYNRFVACWGKHSCHMGVVKTLKALAEIPSDQRSEQVKGTIAAGVDYLLQHHIYKKSHDLSQVSKPGWLRPGFPLMYQDDILEILRILTRLEVRDERMQEAVDVVISKQDPRGRWKLESTFNGRFQTDIEQKGKPSKWITLHALEVLKKYCRENGPTG